MYLIYFIVFQPRMTGFLLYLNQALGVKKVLTPLERTPDLSNGKYIIFVSKIKKITVVDK